MTKGAVFSFRDSILAVRESILGEGFGTFDGTWRFCDMFVFRLRLVSDFTSVRWSFGGVFVIQDGTNIESLSLSFLLNFCSIFGLFLYLFLTRAASIDRSKSGVGYA